MRVNELRKTMQDQNTPPMRRRTLLAATVSAAALPALSQTGQNAARIIVPFAAGGAHDMPARIIRQDLGRILGQNWIVENRPGAGGAIGTAYVAQQPGDGRTLLMTASSHFIAPAPGAKPTYDAVKDFTPVALIGEQSYVMIVQAALPVKTVQELIAHARKNPGTLNYNSGGAASSTHLAAAYFCTLAGVQMAHVAFNDVAEAVNDVVGGRGHVVFVPTAGAGVYQQDTRVRVLATTATKRAAMFPKVPTVAESGLPRYAFESWFGLLASSKTPAPVVAKINAAVNKVIAIPDVREKLMKVGIEPAPVSVSEFNKVFLADRDLKAKIVKESGITRE